MGAWTTSWRAPGTWFSLPERIDEEGWGSQHGHVDRYRWASKYLGPTDTVLDIACGIGYGAELLKESGADYIGVDKPGVPSETFARDGVRFIETDIDHWRPDFIVDVSICFETLEHVKYPDKLADTL